MVIPCLVRWIQSTPPSTTALQGAGSPAVSRSIATHAWGGGRFSLGGTMFRNRYSVSLENLGARRRGRFAAMMLGAAALQLSSSAAAQANNSLNIESRRSLAITDIDILEGFPMRRVMDQLAELSGVQGLTGLSLFRQWWDTQNRLVNGVFSAAPHCDDELIAGVPSLNGYPYDCREAPHEGRQAQCSSFDDPDCAYRPIGLFNRFDLARQDGAHCGEYRIIYAKEGGIAAPLDRNLVIFEATVPNPNPGLGLAACRPIVERWAHLSQLSNTNARRQQLEQMYFDGVGATIPAIIQPAHFGDNEHGWGQIRTNQFAGFQAVTPRVWTLREFKLQRDCSGGGGAACKLLFVPAPAQVNAFGPLFSPASTLPQKIAFDAFFPSQVSSLAASSIAGIGMDVPEQFDTGQSHSSGSSEMNYPLHFGSGPSALRTAIDDALTLLGSSLSADDIVARAQAMTCAGCHKLSDNRPLGGGLVWPASLSFVHVTERQTEVVAGSIRYVISPALTNAFLPHRKAVMEDFLTGVPLPQVPPALPIGGRLVH